jgi:signal transduction histidine kinase
MIVDTQAAAGHLSSTSPDVRDQWVDAQLVDITMEQTRHAMAAATLGLPVFVFFLWDEVPWAGLVVWAALVVLAMAYRFRVLRQYHQRYVNASASERLGFMQRHAWTWGLIGVLWGGGIGLAFPQGSWMAQFVCGLIFLSQGVLSLTTMSTYLPVFHRFVNGWMGALFLGLLLSTLLDPASSGAPKYLPLLGLILPIFWWLMRVAAARLSQVQRTRLELQFSNEELIGSLTQQTRALRRAVATKNRFLASAAHDLRQPVHALSLYADWLLADPEMAREVAPRILQSTRAINELFDSLFDLTRIDAGNYQVRLQRVEVPQLLADMLVQFGPVAAAKSLKLHTRAQPSSVWADPVMLRRILGNLLSNALKHTQQGGVLLAVRRRGDHLVFEVWDTGVGIALEDQQSIFQEFFRVSQHQGTEDSLGLGLTIVSRLCALMGYELSLSSEPGKGSVFRVMLPAHTLRAPVEPPPAAQAPAQP